MTARGVQAVKIARAWIGTPYLHQASVKGAGADCLGLLRGVWRELYGQEPEVAPPYTPDWSEPDGQERLWDAALRHLVPVEPALAGAGCVTLFRMCDGAVAKHLGLRAAGDAGPSFIHAYSGHGVVESPLSAPWARRIVACFAFP
jgi:NlpC/P60 family putative phage cell wall peptidase